MVFFSPSTNLSKNGGFDLQGLYQKSTIFVTKTSRLRVADLESHLWKRWSPIGIPLVLHRNDNPGNLFESKGS